MESIECYSDEELYEGIQEIVSSSVVGACLAPSDKPQAILLGGQSGAGKTTLHNVFRNAMNGNVIVVNGDEYRSFHPRYKQICAQYGIDSPAHTAAWAGRMVEAIIDALSIMGYNLIIEGTLRTSEVPLKTARLLRDRGYSVSLALMAVKPEISLISCQLRYEQMRIAEELVISENTVRMHSKRIYAKLDIHKKQDLIDLVDSFDPEPGS